MQKKDMEIRVFFIPGGERASLVAYEKFVELLEVHDDLLLTVYRGPNKYDGTWSLVLIGEKTSFSRYQQQIENLLSEVQARRINVPPESLVPLVDRFLARQAEMLQTKETFVEKHYPLDKKRPAKKKASRQSKKGKKRR